MKTVLIIVCILLGIVIFFLVFNKIYRYKTIDKKMIHKVVKNAIILDVRTHKEYQKDHIQGAINISLGTIKRQLVALDATQTYITYCSHGIRSVEAKNILKNQGFKKIYNGGAMSDLKTILRNKRKK